MFKRSMFAREGERTVVVCIRHHESRIAWWLHMSQILLKLTPPTSLSHPSTQARLIFDVATLTAAVAMLPT